MLQRIIWNPTRWRRALLLKRRGLTYVQIAHRLGLTLSQVHNKFANEHLAQTAARKHAEERARLAERNALPRPQTLTALICGDPLPGRSALDRRGR